MKFLSVVMLCCPLRLKTAVKILKAKTLQIANRLRYLSLKEQKSH